MKRLTHEVHDRVRAVVQPGETVVDATAGNGYDTVFLAECVGPTGRVIAIDRQAVAIEQCQNRHPQAKLENVEFILGDHANLSQWVRFPVAAVLLNLGYLPHGDHAITTAAHSTLQALQAAKQVVRPRGIVTILAYRGHPGGADEAAAVHSWAMELSPDQWQVDVVPASDNPISPVLYVVQKTGC